MGMNVLTFLPYVRSFSPIFSNLYMHNVLKLCKFFNSNASYRFVGFINYDSQLTNETEATTSVVTCCVAPRG
jgi:hypothetical protein